MNGAELVGRSVRGVYQGIVMGDGRVIAYIDRPSYFVAQDDGRRVVWRAEECVPLDVAHECGSLTPADGTYCVGCGARMEQHAGCA